MYQALSSGVEAGDALTFIEKSAKAARAGLASTFETVDAGTSVMASFAVKGSEIEHVYDKMFETVKRGKIEMPQIAQSIGLVSNIAAQAGVTIDEMFGAIATGSRTNRPAQTIEGFRQSLANIIKPSQEAADLAQKLGIQFDSAALKSKGFAQFLNEVTKATGGNQQEMATLFGDVQALAFVMSITGNQANQLAEDIKGVSEASGTVDAAFAKQMQSLDAQITTFKNSVLQGFTTLFTAIEPFLAGILKFINEHPAAFIAAAIAVGGLTAAYTLLNTNLALFAVTQVPQVLAGLKNIIFLMTNLTLTLQAGTAAEIAAMATGWGALIAVLGIVAYAMQNAGNAIDKANQITLDSINANSQSLKTYQDLSVEAHKLAQEQNQNADIHDRLNAILGRLDPVTQAYIKSLTDEKSQVKALNAELDRNVEIRTATLEAQLRTTAEGILAQQKLKDEQKAYIQDLQQNINETQELMNKPLQDLTGRQLEKVNEGRIRIDLWSQSIVAADEKVSGFNQRLAENEIKLIQSAKGLNLTTEQLRRFFLNAGYSSQQTDILTAAYQNATQSQGTFGSRMSATNGVIDEQTNKIASLRDQLKGLMSETQARVDEKISAMAILAKDKAEAKRQAEFFKKYDVDLQRDLNETKRLTENEKTIREVLQPTPNDDRRTRRPRTPNPAADFRRENSIISGNAQWDKWVYEAASKFGIDPLLIFAQMSGESAFKRGAVSQKGASGLMQLMPGTARGLGVTNIFDPKQNIFAGVKYLRQNLDKFGGNVALALAGYNAGPGAVEKYGGIPPYAETQGYVKKVSDRYQKLKGGKFELGSNFDLEKSLAEQSDKITKETRDAAVLKAIESARTTHVKPDDDVVREYNRILTEEARRTGALQPSFEETQREFSNFRERGNGLPVEKEKTVNDLIRERFDLDAREEEYIARKVNFQEEIAARQEDYNLSLKEAQQDNEIEAAMLAKRNLQLEASVEFGKQQNEQYKSLMDTEVALDVLRRQNADETFVAERRRLAVKSEELSLEKEISNLQDEIANSGVNDSLKIQAAYLRDILDLRSRELDAVISINHSELELSHSMEISNNQIRARVLEHLAQQKTLNESIADGIIQTYEAVADRAGRALDELNEKTKGFLSFIIEPAKAIQHNFIGGFFKTIVNGIFGADIGSQLTKTNNPVARPVVDKLDETNAILRKIAANQGIAATGGNLGSILSGINPGFNPSGVLGGLINFISGGGSHLPGQVGVETGITGINGLPVGQSGGGSILDRIRQVFSTGQGGIFAPRQNVLSGGTSRMGGILGGIGDIAGMVGGIVGGRVGNVISLAGQGASIGSMFGPWGAVIGAAAGGLLGLFMGDPKRKEDKKTNIPNLRQGFADSIKEFKQLIADLDGARITASEAEKQADQIRASIQSGFNIDFKSKKYRKIAQSEIRQQLAEIDRVPGGLMEQLHAAITRRREGEEFKNRFVATFATGVFMDSGFAAQFSDFKRRNGLLSGGTQGVDSLPSLLMPGEIVANQMQQERIRRVAGFDVFAYAGIPNYPKKQKPVKMATGGYIGTAQTSSNSAPPTGAVFNGNIILEGVVALPDAKGYLETPDGKRQVINISREHVRETGITGDGLARDLEKVKNK
jgi:TP901 family phage tail tape measure protein